MIFVASRDAFRGFTFAVFSTYKIHLVVAAMINLSLIESSMFFFQLKLLIYCIRSKAYDVVMVVDSFFH